MTNDPKLTDKFIRTLQQQNQDLVEAVTHLSHELEEYRTANASLIEYLKDLELQFENEVVN